MVRLIMDRCPDQLKLPFALWTREAVRELIVGQTGLDLSVWTVGRLLRGWGFTPQKPVRRAHGRTTAAVRRWMKETYPGISREAKAQGGEIHWGDDLRFLGRLVRQSEKKFYPIVMGTRSIGPRR